MNVSHFFDTHPVFRNEEFSQFMKEQGRHRQASCRQQLSYHHKVGHLIHIRRHLYAVKPSSIPQDEYWIDPYLIAGKATQDAVIGYHSALEIYNLAYTTFEELTFLTIQPSQPFAYQGQRFHGTHPPKALLDNNQSNFGIDIIKRGGVNIKITSLERTLVDILDRPDLSGGWEEICRSFEHVTQFDAGKLVEYALLLNNATTIAKVGFFLEQLPEYLAVPQKFINQLLPHIPKQTRYLERERKTPGKHIEKWSLIIPLQIIEQRWEESHVADV